MKKYILIAGGAVLIIIASGFFLIYGRKNTSRTFIPETFSEAEARKIAEETCIKGGEALGPGTFNENSQTWWFDANLNATREGCNPACVVGSETKQAEINWRCTGLIRPD